MFPDVPTIEDDEEDKEETVDIKRCDDCRYMKSINQVNPYFVCNKTKFICHQCIKENGEPI